MNVQDHFSHRHSNTVFIAPSNNAGSPSLKVLRGSILKGFKGSKDEREYHPHLTIGQTLANAPPMLEYLLNKARLLLPFEWQVGELVVLIRERMPEKSKMESRMKIWGSVNLSLDTAMSVDDSPGFRYPQEMKDKDLDEQEECHALSNSAAHLSGTHRPTQHLRGHSGSKTSSARPELTYCFCPENSIWKPVDSSLPPPDPEHIPSHLRISSYNVLHDPSLTLSTEDRYPILLRSILSDSALSDILILQEVSDDFLPYLLSNNMICSHYSFATHTPINPLPSLRNIVVLTRWNLTWEYLSFEQRHKGAVVLQLSNIGISKGEGWKSLVVVGVHLSSGLSDSGVAARQSQIQSLMSYLGKKYPTNPWIVAGDFNIATSRAAMEEAVEMKSISTESARTSE
jgi:endonuclease/exonuclease/phosphatase family metal-dependent hydrolase